MSRRWALEFSRPPRLSRLSLPLQLPSPLPLPSLFSVHDANLPPRHLCPDISLPPSLSPSRYLPSLSLSLPPFLPPLSAPTACRLPAPSLDFSRPLAPLPAPPAPSLSSPSSLPLLQAISPSLFSVHPPIPSLCPPPFLPPLPAPTTSHLPSSPSSPSTTPARLRGQPSPPPAATTSPSLSLPSYRRNDRLPSARSPLSLPLPLEPLPPSSPSTTPAAGRLPLPLPRPLPPSLIEACRRPPAICFLKGASYRSLPPTDCHLISGGSFSSTIAAEHLPSSFWRKLLIEACRRPSLPPFFPSALLLRAATVCLFLPSSR